MEFRVGTCTSCSAQFKVPATFKGNKAKCKSCDGGVVEVGPVQSDAPKAAPAAPKAAAPKPMPAKRVAKQPAPKPAPKATSDELEEYKPSGKKSSGPSMMERLKAERAAAAKAAGDEPEAAAKPNAPAKPKAAARKPVKARATAKATAGDDDGSKSSKRPARGRAGRSTAGSRSSSRSSAKRAGGASRRKRGGDDGEDEGRGSRRGRAAKKKSPAPLIGVIVVLALGGFGAWKFLGQGDEPVVEAAEANDVAAAAAPEAPAEDATQLAAAEPEPESTEPEATEATDAAAPDESAADEAATEAPEEEAPKPEVDLDSVDLSAIQQFGKVDDTTDEEWTEIVELTDTFLDPNAGAAGNRARKSLFEYGRKAMPAIINKMTTFDYGTEQGYRDGDLGQKLMMEICNGTNVDWRYTTEPKDHLFNKKAVRLWAQMWEKAENDLAYWANMAKLKDDEQPPAPKADVEDDLDALDDL